MKSAYLKPNVHNFPPWLCHMVNTNAEYSHSFQRRLRKWSGRVLGENPVNFYKTILVLVFSALT